MKRIEVELDFEKVFENTIENTIVEGLSKDKEEIISNYSKETFEEMQRDYRYYGAIFGINFKENLEKEFEKIIEKEKEN